MRPETTITCDCGQVAIMLEGRPIVSAECLCTSCQKAGEYLQSLPGATPLLDDKGATHFVIYRKDRVQCKRGAESLQAHRLSPDSKTRRVIAKCCNSAIFLEFTQGHWLSIYGNRWPDASPPPIEMRTMARDKRPGAIVPDDVPNAETHSLGFFAKLIGAWAAMGFRTPKIDFVNGAHDGR